jgi:dUTP pyrophosphatase
MADINIIKMYPAVKLPEYKTDGAACFDISAYFHNSPIDTIYVHDTAEIETGLIFEIPKNYVLLIFSRSGHGFKDDVRLANCVGVIDSDYRGEVKIKLTNDSNKRKFKVSHGDRIAQGMIVPAPQWSFKQVKELTSTARGKGGMGSTGS